MEKRNNEKIEQIAFAETLYRISVKCSLLVQAQFYFSSNDPARNL